MDGKILQIRLSLDSHSNRVWCYFLVHIFKIKSPDRFQKSDPIDIAKSLKISFGEVEILAVSISFKPPLKQKKNAVDYNNPCLSFSVQKFRGRTDIG